MNKKPFQSKKFIALATGVGTTILFVLVSILAILLRPETSASVVNLMTVALASINGVIGIYAIGQSAVDFKINSNHETSQKTESYSELKEQFVKYENA